MMPLIFANTGEENIIKKVGGTPEVRKHLKDIGFNVGSKVTVINTMGGNVIVNVLGTRIAVSKEMAQKIMI
ncbi:MAG: ferrous iron transport protein A [Ruminococcus sp.]